MNCLACAESKKYGEFRGAPKPTTIYCTLHKGPRHYNATCEHFRKDATKLIQLERANGVSRKGRCVVCGFTWTMHQLVGMADKVCTEWTPRDTEPTVQLGLGIEAPAAKPLTSMEP